MDYSKILDFLTFHELDQNFAELDSLQYKELKALGVPEFDDHLPVGEGYVYAGTTTFQWTDKPRIIHL